MPFEYINLLIEATCLVIAWIFLRKVRNPFARASIAYVALVLVIELIAAWYGHHYRRSNAWCYNLLIIFETLYVCYGLFIFLHPLSSRARHFLIVSLGSFAIVYVYELYASGFYRLNTWSVAMLSFCVIVQCLLYYHLLLKKAENISLKNHAPFWWVSAVLFFYFGSTVYNLFLAMPWMDLMGSSRVILIYIISSLNLVLYGLWSYSFICSSHQQKLP